MRYRSEIAEAASGETPGGGPFQRASDLRLVFPSPSQLERYALLLNAVYSDKPLAALVGAPGTGKSLFLRRLQRDLKDVGLSVVLLESPITDLDVFWSRMREELGLARGAGAIEQRLSDSTRPIAVLLDEGDAIPDGILNEILSLASVTRSGTSALRVVVAGQRRLKHRLESMLPEHERPETIELEPFSAREAESYMDYRIRFVADQDHLPFTAEAVSCIVSFSGGIPGRINALCASSMLAADVEEQGEVTGDLVKRVAAELGYDTDSGSIDTDVLERVASDARKAAHSLGFAEQSEEPEWERAGPTLETREEADSGNGTARSSAPIAAQASLGEHETERAEGRPDALTTLKVADDAEIHPSVRRIGSVKRRSGATLRTLALAGVIAIGVVAWIYEQNPDYFDSTTIGRLSPGAEPASRPQAPSAPVGEPPDGLAGIEAPPVVRAPFQSRRASEPESGPRSEDEQVRESIVTPDDAESNGSTRTPVASSPGRSQPGRTPTPEAIRKSPPRSAATKPRSAAAEEQTSSGPAPAEHRRAVSDAEEATVPGGSRSESDVDAAASAPLPLLQVRPAAGSEDAPTTLDIVVNLEEDGGDHFLTVSGLPSGASLSKGTQGRSSWRIRAGNAAGLQLIPPRDYAGEFTLSVNLHRGTGGGVLATGEMPVTIKAVADPPRLRARASPGDIDSAIPLEIKAWATDSDGSERLSIVVRGVPATAQLSKGVEKGGDWRLGPDDLTDLVLTPRRGTPPLVRLSVTAIATESASGDSASTTESLEIRVVDR